MTCIVCYAILDILENNLSCDVQINIQDNSKGKKMNIFKLINIFFQFVILEKKEENLNLLAQARCLAK